MQVCCCRSEPDRRTNRLTLVFADRKGDAKCEKVLKELENIDDELDTHDIPFVKIDDEDVIKEYGIDAVPQLVYFEDSIPNFYSGERSLRNLIRR